MKFSKSWLDELIGFKLDLDQLADRLTMAGLEVAKVLPIAKNFCGVVIGEVLEVSKHPNADKLNVCKVNIGTRDHLTIVCGASNVCSGLLVPVALTGAKLGDNLISKARLRGVESSGMICSASELGIAEVSSGILELPDNAPIGEDLREYLMLNDSVVEIELTPDRGDCLGIIGIARELSAINNQKFDLLNIAKLNNKVKISSKKSIFPVKIDAKDFCPHYAGRVIRGVDNKIITPIWIKERLRRSDIRCINPIVDITNYVMLELGQPLHAFDLAKIDREIQVRYAKANEKITLLDGKLVELTPQIIVIADYSKPLALAGIMGGVDSGVASDTTDIFLESAFFIPEKLSIIARELSLQTDASYRYERGVDYELQRLALDRATALILEITGGISEEVSEVTVNENLPSREVICLYRFNIKKMLGVILEDKDITNILLNLGMQVEFWSEGWKVTPPSWRFDIKIEDDIIEEVARIYGYHRIPEQEIIAELLPPNNFDNRANEKPIYKLMSDLGYNETITYSFVDEKLQSLFCHQYEPLLLVNPISQETNVMRTTLFPGLINTIRYNLNRKQQHLRLFEIGLCFLQSSDSVLNQTQKIAAAVCGNVNPEQWGIKQNKLVDFFDLKNDVNSLLEQLTDIKNVEYVTISHPALHPKKSAGIYLKDNLIGYLGELNPKISQHIDLDKQIYLFEIELEKITENTKLIFNEFSRFPKVRRDVALLIDKEIPWQVIKQEIIDISGELLQNIDIFDVYKDEVIGDDKKSIAIHLDFQSISRTLVDSEIESLVNEVVFALKQKFNAILRG